MQNTASSSQTSRRLGFRFIRATALIIGGTLILLAVGIFRGHTQGSMLVDQYRAMHFSTSGQPIAYHFDPALSEADRILDEAEHEDHDTPGSSEDPASDKCELIGTHRIPLGGAGDPAPLARLNAYMDYQLPDSMQTVFCHGMQAPDGTSRLVVISIGPDLNPRTSFVASGALLEALFIEPAAWTGMPRVVGRQRILLDNADFLLLPTDFSFGELSKDGSVVIRYSGAGTAGVLRGRLLGGKKMQWETLPQSRGLLPVKG